MRKLVIAIGIFTALATAGTAFAQEEVHFEGYWVTNPVGGPGTTLDGRGLVTALYPPLVSNFVANEYTWTTSGLSVAGSSVVGTTTYQTFNLAGALFTIYEDATQDARPTFYLCPSDIIGADGRYQNGPIYLQGHYTAFSATFDVGTTTGTFNAQVNWDSGSHLTDFTPARRGAAKFGGTTTQNSTGACIPPGYQIGMTARIFQVTTASNETSWGTLKKVYR